MPGSKELTEEIIRKLVEPDGSKYVQNLIKNGQLDVDAIESNGHGILFYAVMNIKDKNFFQNFMETYHECGGNINLVSEITGHTAMDAPLTEETVEGVTQLHWKKSILKEYGAKPGREVSLRQSEIAAAPITPGYNSAILSLDAAVPRFSFKSSDLISVDTYVSDPQRNTDGCIDVGQLLNTKCSAIGSLYADENVVLSTCFLISNKFIITARHSVNDQDFASLSVSFEKDARVQFSSISGIVESGANFGLDYIIFELKNPITGIDSLQLTDDNMSDSLLFIGRHHEKGLVFSSVDNSNPGGLDIVAYHKTEFTLSGSPYFGLNGCVCGLHLHASIVEKTGLYISRIISDNPASILATLVRGKSVNDVIHFEYVGVFAKFTGAISELGEFDEGGRPKFTIDDSSGALIVSYKGRYTNQNDSLPRRKIKKRLQKLRDIKKETLTGIQEKYLALLDGANLSKAEINIAHNISFQTMCNGFVHMINTPISPRTEAAEIKAFEDFAAEIASTDDEKIDCSNSGQIKKRVPELVKKIRADQKKPGGLIKTDAKILVGELDQVMGALNKKSRNLMPGHARANNGIHGSRDPHLIKSKNGGYKETEISARLAVKASVCFGAMFKPEDKSVDGKIHSSSVDCNNDSAQAYYTP